MYELTNDLGGEIVIVGGGQLCDQIFERLRTDSNINCDRIVGYVDDNEVLGSINKKTIKHLGSTSSFFTNANLHRYQLLPAIGYLMLSNRLKLLQNLKLAGASFVSVVSNMSSISNSCSLGSGVFVGDMTVLDPNTLIDDFCYLDIGCLIGEFSEVGKGSYLSSRVTICGNCSIDEGVFLGSGVIAVDKLKIGARVWVNAGSLISRDIDCDKRVVSGERTKVLPI